MRSDRVENARAIIEAAVGAAWDQSPASVKAAEEAVERAVGHLGLVDPPNGQWIIDDALVEIAKQHVRERVMHRFKAA